jgi:hypothetical protein
MNKWFLYVLSLAFAVYWASNLLLWYPWSYSTTLGMTLMLTLSPVLWSYTVYLGLISYPEKNIMRSAVYIALIFLLIAVVSDYLFFGLVRDALEELYHPTTLYGYAFVIFLPFILSVFLRKKIESAKRVARNKDFLNSLVVGSICFISLVMIILAE